MKDSIVPKWQRELKQFLGVKSGIILEGNVYDEFTRFWYGEETPEFWDTNDLDKTILSLVKDDETEVFFFNPIEGLYHYLGSEASDEEQRSILMTLFDAKDKPVEARKDHGRTLCLMPNDKRAFGGNGGETNKYVSISEIVRDTMRDKPDGFGEKNVVFVLNFSSRLGSFTNQADTNAMFLNLMVATTSLQRAQKLCNTLVMVVDKYNDIPAWVYLNNPNIRTISICAPDRNTRRLYLENLCGYGTDYRCLSDDKNKYGKQFVAETEGLQLQELKQILDLAHQNGIKAEDIDKAFKLYKYGVSDNPWENLEDDILTHLEAKLSERVKGQDEALKKVKSVMTRAVKGLSGLQHSGSSHKPKGILFFAGPTGVGKTETAKSIAEAIFGDENACIRFDMSEYRLAESDQKLFGAPPGYVGYEGGGQLTNAIKNRPFSVLLFDEIEKASPTIMDKFLQILEDGRMTDNQGNTVYFGESVIIFTSNIGLTKEVYENEQDFITQKPHREPTITIEDPNKPDSEEFQEKVKTILTEGVKSYFTDNGRPELLNRLGEDNIVVFQFINVDGAKSICDYKLRKICETIETEKGLHIDTNGAVEAFREKAVAERANGGRGVGNMLEREFLNPLGDYLCSCTSDPTSLKCYVKEGKVEFERTDHGN